MKSTPLVGLLAFATAASAVPTKRNQPGSTASIQNFKDKIKNVVVLVMENRSFDNLLGGQTTKGLENPINNGPYCNPYNVSDSSEGSVCSAAKDYDSVADDPDHAVYGNNFEFYGTFLPDESLIQSSKLTPSQSGFVQEQIRLYSSDANRTELATQVMNYYTEEQVPILTTLVQNFLTFNHWHSDVPGVSRYYLIHW
jgi:phospholipase C